jgi:hypothetical protein
VIPAYLIGVAVGTLFARPGGSKNVVRATTYSRAYHGSDDFVMSSLESSIFVLCVDQGW